jgi:hypothetical protein
MHYTKMLIWIIGLLCFSCQDTPTNINEPDHIAFAPPQAVSIQGYDGHIMEPFISRDGSILFFNNLNAPTENTNLHWCTKINDTRFQYQGELDNVNTESLEGVPTMDKDNNFFFVYTGTYEQTLSTIYRGQFSSGSILHPELVENISRKTPGWVNFDVEVSHDGNTLYFVDGRFDANGGPYESNFVMAQKQGDQFFRDGNAEKIFKNINTNDLEYAAAISKNELEICFTRVAVPLNAQSEPKIFIASRNNVNEAFSNVHPIQNITGFVEAPTYDANDQGIYFHKRLNGQHRLYYARKL